MDQNTDKNEDCPFVKINSGPGWATYMVTIPDGFNLTYVLTRDGGPKRPTGWRRWLGWIWRKK